MMAMLEKGCRIHGFDYAASRKRARAVSKCSDNKLQTALRNYLIGSALTLTALGSSALGLGRVQGAAWIGKPLSVSVPVRLEIPEEPSALCPEVEVFQGDTRVNPDRVTVVVGGRNPREPVLQVRAAVLVEEPVVTLYVRVGLLESNITPLRFCWQSRSRSRIRQFRFLQRRRHRLSFDRSRPCRQMHPDRVLRLVPA
jgi:hypothetical protein